MSIKKQRRVYPTKMKNQAYQNEMVYRNDNRSKFFSENLRMFAQ